MFSLRLLVLFIHVTAVIVALGGSLFSTFALAPVLAEELDGAARIRVARRVIRRLGAIVLSALAVLVVTGILNVIFVAQLARYVAKTAGLSLYGGVDCYRSTNGDMRPVLERVGQMYRPDVAFLPVSKWICHYK